MIDKELKEMETRHEGYRLYRYKDSKRIDTIGVGHNMVARPLPADMATYLAVHGCITPAMVDRLLEEDIDTATRSCERVFGNYHDIRKRRQYALVDVMFNMGERKVVEKFPGFVDAVIRGDWERAAEELEWKNPDTKQAHTGYWTQTKGRAVEIAEMIRDG